MHANKSHIKPGRKPRSRKYGMPDNAALFIICGALVLALIFIAILIVTSPV